MALSYRTRRFLSAIVLLVGLPLYIATCLYVISLFERPSIVVELLIYVVLGVIWAFPFKGLFKGIGRENPENAKEDEQP